MAKKRRHVRRGLLPILVLAMVCATEVATQPAKSAKVDAPPLNPHTARADPTIGFDDLAPGAVVSSQYVTIPGGGVTFRTGAPGFGLLPVVEAQGGAHSGAEVASISECSGCEFFMPKAAGYFSRGMATVSLFVGAFPVSPDSEGSSGVATGLGDISGSRPVSATIALRAYTTTGALVGTHSAIVYSDRGFDTRLSVTAASGAPIAYFTVSAPNSSDENKRIGIDDLSFSPIGIPVYHGPDFLMRLSPTTADMGACRDQVTILFSRVGAFNAPIAITLGVIANVQTQVPVEVNGVPVRGTESKPAFAATLSTPKIDLSPSNPSATVTLDLATDVLRFSPQTLDITAVGGGKQHYASLTVTRGCAPLDMAWSATDPNNIPLNPEYRWQLTHPDQPVDYYGLGCWQPIWQTTHCTQQPTWIESGRFCFGHINWPYLATYGPANIYWSDWSGPVKDDDYNWILDTPRRIGQTTAERMLKLEWSSDEVTDHIDNGWWHDLNAQIVRDTQNGYDYYSEATFAMTDDRLAIVTGVFGLDFAHNAWTEVHPVFAQTMNEDVDRRAADDRWVFFIRNWGSEGGCSGADPTLEVRRFSVLIPWFPDAYRVEPLPTTYVDGYVPDDYQGYYSLRPEQGQGVLLTVTLPPPDDEGFAYGEIHLRWNVCAGCPSVLRSLPPVTRPILPEDSFDNLFNGFHANRGLIAAAKQMRGEIKPQINRNMAYRRKVTLRPESVTGLTNTTMPAETAKLELSLARLACQADPRLPICSKAGVADRETTSLTWRLTAGLLALLGSATAVGVYVLRRRRGHGSG